MSTGTPEASTAESARENSVSGSLVTADSLSMGLLLILSLAVVQRAVGFGRGILFCRLLSPEQLGHWDLIFKFLSLAAPLLVFGLPGSFPRYAEHFRARGQLRKFVLRVVLVSSILAGCGCALLFGARESVAVLILGDARHASLIPVLSLSLLAVICFNLLTSLFTSLRMARATAMTQLFHSLLFSILGVGLVWFWRAESTAVLLAYGAACGLVLVVAVGVLRRLWNQEPPSTEPCDARSFWKQVLPFAIGLWLTNILANMCGMVDRYMILHLEADKVQAAELIGNYHSSQIVPALMVAVAGLMGAVLLPHLSHDWEHGASERVNRRMNLFFKLLGIGFTAGGFLVILASPILFGWLLENKYVGGAEVVHWALLSSMWFGLCLIAQSYLWCAEKPRLVSLTYALGLVANVVLNATLFPVWGLQGAVLATAVSMGLSMLLTMYLAQREGLRWDAGAWWVAALPLVLACNLWGGMLALVVVLMTAILCNGLFTEEERLLCADFLGRGLPFARRFQTMIARNGE